MTEHHQAKSHSHIIVRFAGDSGDGMQLLGNEWVKACAAERNDLATMPDFPAEIRAPQGTLAGISGFQIQFASQKIFTAGDRPDALVALNPAALKVNLSDLKRGGLIIVNSAAFNELNLAKASYKENPLLDGSLSDYHLIAIDMHAILREALKDSSLGSREILKTKNFFCLGLLYWLYTRDPHKEIAFIEEKFARDKALQSANLTAFKSGYAYGENTESMPPRHSVLEADLPSGTYRAITGNKAMALGLITAAHRADLSLFFASYPITPASDILHELSAARKFGVTTLQMEDEMAAICASIGASYSGNIGVTATSGPGFALKSEALGYAVMLELPLIVIDVQRAGPSTGIPTKTEQADLMQAIYGRSGESPLPVLAAESPEDCFTSAILAMRIAVNFMTPVVILSDAQIANSSSPWKVVDPDDIAPIKAHNQPHSLPYKPYERDAVHLSRAWVLPKSPDLIHQLGGLEKDQLTGKVSYDARNHQAMVNTRAQKIERIKDFVAPPDLFGADSGDILLIGFGGSFGALRQATMDLMSEDFLVSHLHLRLLNPLHDYIGTVIRKFKQVIVVEHNLGQLCSLLRAKFLEDAQSLNKVNGKPFLVEEISEHVKSLLKPKERAPNVTEAQQ
jgi:2-oxoglutarate ferredoxin oxidoreductase subunit alpha